MVVLSTVAEKSFKFSVIESRLNYLHENAVAAGIVTEPQYYKFRSAVDYYNEQNGLVTITVKAYKTNKHTPFKGQIYANKIFLADLPQLHGLNSTKQGSKGTVMSAGSDEILINNNKISLAPGECEIYDVIEIVPYGCSDGNHYPGTCPWEGSSTQGWDPETSWLPGYYNYRTTIINCAPPSFPSPPTGGGGGGSTTPNPPGGYNPCDCETPTSSAVGENKGGLKLAVAAPNCCDQGGGGLYPLPIDPIAIVINNLSVELGLTYEQKEYLLNNPNQGIAIEHYLQLNGRTIENREFTKWAVGNLMNNNNKSIEELDNDYDPIRYQNYVPRDREPASYPRRTSLSNSDGSDNFSSLTETTPLYTYPNGVMTINLNAYNCHYHTFGLQYATRVDDEHPKWVTAVALKAT